MLHLGDPRSILSNPVSSLAKSLHLTHLYIRRTEIELLRLHLSFESRVKHQILPINMQLTLTINIDTDHKGD